MVFAEAGYKCANSTCRNQLVLELHHIVWVKDGGPTTVANLLALCGHCHNLHTMNEISAASIQTWKAILQSLNNPHRMSADLLLFLYADEEQAAAASADAEKRVPFTFTGDSLGMLAGLLNAKLIKITDRVGNYGYFGGGTPYFKVALTDKGKALVKVWRGDEALA